MREQGFDMVVGSWQGIFVPKGTPANVVSTLYTVGTASMKDAAVLKKLGDGGVAAITSKSPDDFRNFVKSESDRFAKAIKDNNIQTE